jgi:hypothetical protein
MMKQEFEERIGLVITSEEYQEIEAVYMGMPESIDKDKFVEIWLKNGGVQNLLDKRLEKIALLESLVKAQSMEIAAFIEEAKKERAKLIKQLQELEDKIIMVGDFVA